MNKSILRRTINRLLHSLARTLPGSKGLRPFLHRLRGVKVGSNVFIGDEVYIENEYPEAVEIQEGAQISLRAVILAHTRGPGNIVIERDVFIGVNAVIAAPGGKTLRIGEGAVIGSGVTVTNNVTPHLFVTNEPAKPVARATVPLSKAATIEEFVRGLVPLNRRNQPRSGETPRGTKPEN